MSRGLPRLASLVGEAAVAVVVAVVVVDGGGVVVVGGAPTCFVVRRIVPPFPTERGGGCDDTPFFEFQKKVKL